MIPQVTNNTVIVNFARAGRLDMLRKVTRQLFLPIQVYNEIVAGIVKGHKFQEEVRAEILRRDADKWLIMVGLTSPELSLYAQFATNLGAGEAAGMAIAKSREWVFLSDDKKARRLARQADIRVSGTLGVLKMAVEKRLYTLPQVEETLQAMLTAGYYAPMQSVYELIRQ